MEICSHHLETWTNQHSAQLPYSPATDSYMEKSGNPSQQTFNKLCPPVCASLAIPGATGHC